MRQVVLLALFVAACSGPDPDPKLSNNDHMERDLGGTPDASDLSDMTSAATYTAACDPFEMDGGQRSSDAPCSASEPIPGGTRTVVRADCTDPEITANLDKQHVVMRPDSPSRDVLWVHLPGTDGEPRGATNLGLAATQAGYRFIGLAYTNNRNSIERCTCPDGPRPAECKELVRHEIVTGEDVTPWYAMEPDEAIVPRLVALITWLQENDADGGWDAFLDAGAPVWSRVAVSGFSQGAGMTSIVARQFPLERELHFSGLGGSVFGVVLDPASAVACASDADCSAAGKCCGIAEVPCDTPPDDAVCLELVSEPWITRGADTDGDGLGDGDLSTRATPVDRVFVLVHRREPAWQTTPRATEAMGIGGPDAYIDVDTDRGPFPAGARLFSTDLEPNNVGCSYHQSMGTDACQPRDGEGLPEMLPAWRHALTTEL